MVKILSDIENMAVEEFNQKVIKGFGDSPLLRLKKNAKSMLFGKLSFEE